MRWKLRAIVTLLGCCLVSVVSARPQSGGRGLSLIVVPTERSAADLRSQIRSGASFEALALMHSTDPTAARAGYQGIVDEGALRQEFRTALEGLKPGDVSAVTRLGEDFVLLKWTTAAEDLWRTQQDKALSALQRGRYPEAIALFPEAIRLAEELGANDIRVAESLNGLAQTYRYQQNYAAAEPGARRSLAILEQALGHSHQAVLPSLINLAGITRAAEKTAEAEDVYRRILCIRWGTPEVTTVSPDQVLDKLAEVLNLAYAEDPDLEKSLQEYWRLISQSKLQREAYLGMRELLLAVPLLPEAETLMQQAVRQNPDSRRLHYQLGEVYVAWGKYQKAIEQLREALRLSGPSEPTSERKQRSLILSTIAQMNFFLVQFDDAFAVLESALEIHPDNMSARLLRGALYLRRNKFDEAIAEYKRVIAVDSRAADAHEGLAQAGLARGRYSEAVRDADRALEIEPGLQSARYVKAMALIRDGREREGRTVLEEYQQREADRLIAESRSGDIREIDLTSSAMLSQGRSEEALALLRQGTRSHPLNAVLRRKLGLTEGRLGLHREAAENLERLVVLKPDDFLVHRQLSREYDAVGNHEAARQQRVIYFQKYDAVLQAKVN